jgi:hypothetical protein
LRAWPSPPTSSPTLRISLSRLSWSPASLQLKSPSKARDGLTLAALAG